MGSINGGPRSETIGVAGNIHPTGDRSSDNSDTRLSNTTVNDSRAPVGGSGSDDSTGDGHVLKRRHHLPFTDERNQDITSSHQHSTDQAEETKGLHTGPDASTRQQHKLSTTILGIPTSTRIPRYLLRLRQLGNFQEASSIGCSSQDGSIYTAHTFSYVQALDGTLCAHRSNFGGVRHRGPVGTHCFLRRTSTYFDNGGLRTTRCYFVGVSPCLLRSLGPNAAGSRTSTTVIWHWEVGQLQ